MANLLCLGGEKWGKVGNRDVEVGIDHVYGEYQHTIDDKGRIIIPAKFRDMLGTSFVATRGLDSCLFVYPMEEWGIMEQKLKSLSLMKSDARAFSRFFSRERLSVYGTSKAE